MNTQEIRKKLEAMLHRRNWETSWHREEEKIKVHIEGAAAPFDISLPQFEQKMNRGKLAFETLAAELVQQITIVEQSMKMREGLDLAAKESDIYPVMRSASFPRQTAQGVALVYEEHTAESTVYFAVDLDKSYALIDAEQLKRSGWAQQELKEKALFNLRGLQHEPSHDEVAGNVFTFISPKDGYAASRILNHKLIDTYRDGCTGDFCLAIPHQDVLILSDVRNASGYDVLGQMAMHFYRNGDMPITPLPFEYKEGKVSPIFIMAKTRPGRKT